MVKDGEGVGEREMACLPDYGGVKCVRQLSVGASENVSYFTSSPPFQQESAYLVLDQWWRLSITFHKHSKSSFHHFDSVEVEIF